MPHMPKEHEATSVNQYMAWNGELTGGPGGPGKPGRPEVQEQVGAEVGQVSSSL